MKREIQEKLWIEAGETVEGLIQLLNKKSKTSKLWIELTERKEKQEQLSAV